jgi:hypothetical protein
VGVTIFRFAPHCNQVSFAKTAIQTGLWNRPIGPRSHNYSKSRRLLTQQKILWWINSHIASCGLPNNLFPICTRNHIIFLSHGGWRNVEMLSDLGSELLEIRPHPTEENLIALKRFHARAQRTVRQSKHHLSPPSGEQAGCTLHPGSQGQGDLWFKQSSVEIKFPAPNLPGQWIQWTADSPGSHST